MIAHEEAIVLIAHEHARRLVEKGLQFVASPWPIGSPAHRAYEAEFEARLRYSVKTGEISRLTGVHPTMVAEIRQGVVWRELGANPWMGLGA